MSASLVITPIARANTPIQIVSRPGFCDFTWPHYAVKWRVDNRFATRCSPSLRTISRRPLAVDIIFFGKSSAQDIDLLGRAFIKENTHCFILPPVLVLVEYSYLISLIGQIRCKVMRYRV
jgi:hypothetical protein